MRPRHLLPITLLVLGALIAPACSSDDSTDTASSSSNERDSGADSGKSDKSGDSGDSGDSGNSGDSGDSGDSGANPDETPGLDDLTESIPGLEDMGDCITQATAFSSLYFETLGGGSGAEDAQKKAEELKKVLPEDLHDDIDVISKAIGEVAEEGLMSGTDALETEEYKAAEQAISKYFEEECGSGG